MDNNEPRPRNYIMITLVLTLILCIIEVVPCLYAMTADNILINICGALSLLFFIEFAVKMAKAMAKTYKPKQQE